MTIEIRGEDALHGKRVKLTRSGKDITGVMIAQDMKNQSDNFMFRWIDESGKTCLSPVDKDELKMVRDRLASSSQNPPDTKEG